MNNVTAINATVPYDDHAQRLCRHFVNSKPKHFKDEDILELFLYSCGAGTNSSVLSRQLLASFGSFTNIITAAAEELFLIDGMNERIIAGIKLVSESAMRLLKTDVEEMSILNNKEALLKYCKALLAHLKVEQFHIFYLDKKNRLIVGEMLSEGTVDNTPVYPREVVKRTLDVGASSVILVHNHPSGSTEPSKADKKITRDIIMALAPLGIEVNDHLIIAKDKHFSFYENGLM